MYVYNAQEVARGAMLSIVPCISPPKWGWGLDIGRNVFHLYHDSSLSWTPKHDGATFPGPGVYRRVAIREGWNGDIIPEGDWWDRALYIEGRVYAIQSAPFRKRECNRKLAVVSGTKLLNFTAYLHNKLGIENRYSDHPFGVYKTFIEWWNEHTSGRYQFDWNPDVWLLEWAEA
jgi:hypothetical protein